jgi:ABC-type sugar transport system, permease component
MKEIMKKNKKASRTNYGAMVFLILGLSAVIFPLYIAIVVSLKAPSDMTLDVAGLLSLPSKFILSNYAEAIRVTDFWRSMANSLFITIATVVLSIVIHSLAGYVIGRGMAKRKTFKFCYLYIISGMFVPFALLMLPLIKQMARLGLANQGGVILGYLVFFMPMNILLYTGYLKNVPITLDEAGYIDGTNTWGTFWKIIFPVMSPMHATVAILTALGTWNDVMLPLILMGGSGVNTLPLAQLTFQTQFGTNYNLAFASYILALIPIVIFYLICQTKIINGVMSGSIK